MKLGEYIIAGTRGWNSLDSEENRKILRREKIRLELSIQDGIQKYGENKQIIVCMHYPPFNNIRGIEYDLISVMKKYNVPKCIYGHLHGPSHKDAIEGLIDGIEYQLVSSDYTDFKLIKLT